ncbi:MAG: hypothetical protein EBW36_01090 [Actinobacteria bacterium]|nr:hypothetical protein [Actinomycetota bacterium]
MIIFVPGYTQRAQLKATTSLMRKEAREVNRNRVLTDHDRLARLLATQRGFSVLFALFLLGLIAAAMSAAVDSSFWFLAAAAGVFSTLSLLVSRAAASQARAIAKRLHKSRQDVRSSAARARARSREWSPNPLPEPLAKRSNLLEEKPVADVIDISKPRRVLASKDIDEILARRRAI